MSKINARIIQELLIDKIIKFSEAFMKHEDAMYLIRRSGEMANTEDLKSSEEIPLAGSSPASGITCKCEHELHIHRGMNGECSGRNLNVSLTYRELFDRITCSTILLVNWDDPNIWCKCKRYEPKQENKP